jgi:uncharacterized protein
VDVATIIGIGLFAGFLIGSIGVGGVIVVPALAYLVEIDVGRAIAVALMGFVLSGAVGTFRYARRGLIQWRTARILIFGAVPATIAGAFMTHEISPVFLKMLVGLVVLSAGIQVLFKQAFCEAAAAATLPAGRVAAIGAVTGFASATTGTGGPLMLIPILIWQQEPILTAIGLSQVIQLPISLVATATNLFAGVLDFRIGLILAVSLATGCWFGASAAHVVPAKALRLSASCLLILIGVVIVVDVSTKFFP